MMSKDFFIMMNYPGARPIPIVEEAYFPAYFETLEEAKVFAEDHHGCSAFGYEIFELGRGEA